MPLIDLHCHILPAIDDGAADGAEALAMARLAVADGIATIVATPHQLGSFTSSWPIRSGQRPKRFSACWIRSRWRCAFCPVPNCASNRAWLKSELVARPARVASCSPWPTVGGTCFWTFRSRSMCQLDRLVAELASAGMVRDSGPPRAEPGNSRPARTAAAAGGSRMSLAGDRRKPVGGIRRRRAATGRAADMSGRRAIGCQRCAPHPFPPAACCRGLRSRCANRGRRRRPVSYASTIRPPLSPARPSISIDPLPGVHDHAVSSV